MFYGVQTHSAEAYLVMVPFSPMIKLGANERVPVLNIIVHKEVVVTQFIGNNIFPAVSMIMDDLVNSRFLPLRIIHAGETLEIPLILGVRFASSRKSEFGIAFNFHCFRQLFFTVVRINPYGMKPLFFVAAGL